MKLLRDPFTQFLICGVLIFVVFRFTGTRNEEDVARAIVVDAPTGEWIYGNFTKQFRRPPSREEMDVLVETYIRNEVKYREALTLGLDTGDSIVRRRLTQKFDFLFGNGAAEVEPEDANLQAWYEEHSDSFAVPARLTFAHLWFSPDSRGGAARGDAAAAVEALRTGADVDGDNFPFEDAYRDVNPTNVRSVFGPEFMELLFEAPLETWVGPVESGLGFHTVRVSERADGTLLPLEDVRGLVLDEWRRAESKEILARRVAELMADYRVTIDADSLNRFKFSPEGQVPTL